MTIVIIIIIIIIMIKIIVTIDFCCLCFKVRGVLTRALVF